VVDELAPQEHQHSNRDSLSDAQTMTLYIPRETHANREA